MADRNEKLECDGCGVPGAKPYRLCDFSVDLCDTCAPNVRRNKKRAAEVTAEERRPIGDDLPRCQAVCEGRRCIHVAGHPYVHEFEADLCAAEAQPFSNPAGPSRDRARRIIAQARAAGDTLDFGMGLEAKIMAALDERPCPANASLDALPSLESRSAEPVQRPDPLSGLLVASTFRIDRVHRGATGELLGYRVTMRGPTRTTEDEADRDEAMLRAVPLRTVTASPDPAREELSFIVSYLAHNDQDANHAWMVRRIRAVLAGKDPRDVEPWNEADGVRQRRSDPR